MTYTHWLPNGTALTTEINAASTATIRAGLAEVERVAGILCPAPGTPLAEAPVSQVDIVTGEAAVAILERLRDLLGVASLGAVEAEVGRLVGPDVLTEWPSEALPGLWRYYPLDADMQPLAPVNGRWFGDPDGGEPMFVDKSREGWFKVNFGTGERFTRIREGK